MSTKLWRGEVGGGVLYQHVAPGIIMSYDDSTGVCGGVSVGFKLASWDREKAVLDGENISFHVVLITHTQSK